MTGATAFQDGSDPYRLLREHTPDGSGGDDATWFAEHRGQAAQRVVSVLAEAGIDLAGLTVADIGCGDGVIDLGVVQQGRPAALVGYELEPVDREGLAAEARRFGAIEADLPAELTFATTGETEIPAPDATYDVVISWSTFEHVRRPVEVFAEIHRILKPGGAFFMQIWPLYHSSHGSHLWPWYPTGFANLLHDRAELERTITANPIGRPDHAAFLLQESGELNRVTVDELQRGLLLADLVPTWVQLDAEDVHLPLETVGYSMLDLGISGITLVAERRA